MIDLNLENLRIIRSKDFVEGDMEFIESILMIEDVIVVRPIPKKPTWQEKLSTWTDDMMNDSVITDFVEYALECGLLIDPNADAS